MPVVALMFLTLRLKLCSVNLILTVFLKPLKNSRTTGSYYLSVWVKQILIVPGSHKEPMVIIMDTANMPLMY